MLLKIWSSIVISITLAALFQLSQAAKTQEINQIYVFGDSLSDPGNVFKATQGQVPQSPPYFRGRYSDGLVWTEYLAQRLKLTADRNANFAYGGATTGNSRQVPLGLLAQIDRYKASNSSANANALYIIWAGANDYLGGGNSTSQPIENLTKAVKSLARIGAKNILVVNLPDLGKLPGTLNTKRAEVLSKLTKQHNSQLAAALKNLRQQFSNPKITYYDVNLLFNQVRSHPKKFGFINVTNTCLSIDRQSQFEICHHPNEYLFWDEIHPSTAAHKLLAETVIAKLRLTESVLSSRVAALNLTARTTEKFYLSIPATFL